jgi:hypothetical protein
MRDERAECERWLRQAGEAIDGAARLMAIARERLAGG